MIDGLDVTTSRKAIEYSSGLIKYCPLEIFTLIYHNWTVILWFPVLYIFNIDNDANSKNTFPTFFAFGDIKVQSWNFELRNDQNHFNEY